MSDAHRTDLIGPEPETIRTLIREHPTLVLTISYVIVTAIGLTYQVLLFQNFHVQILNYADASDFLMAAVRQPVALATFLAAFPLMWLLRRLDAYLLRRWPRFARALTPGWMRRPAVETTIYVVSAALYAWLFTGMYAGWVSDRIKAGTGDPVMIELQNGETVGDGRRTLLIGATSRYLFVYDEATTATIVPVESATRIRELSDEAGAGLLPDLPVPVTNNAVAMLGGADSTASGSAQPLLFSFMGLDASKSWAGITNRAFRFDGEWTEIAPVPGRGRIAATAQSVGGRIYVFGGYTVDPDGSESSVPDVNIYDPPSGVWERGADMPTPVDDAVSGVWRDSLVYVVSGWHDTANVRLVQVYDPAVDGWFEASPVPGPGVFGHAGGVIGDVLVYVDGVVKNPEGPRYSMYAQAWRGDIDPRNPAVIDWRAIERHPGPALYRSAAAVCGDRLLLAGGSAKAYNFDGIGYSGAPAEPERVFLAYDTGEDRWLRAGDLPSATMDHRGLLVTATEAWILGGMQAGQRVSDRVVRIPLTRSRLCVAPSVGR